MSLIEIRGLYKAYSGVPVLKGVDLVLEAGTLTGLVGENGAGKSTLIKILTGLTRHDDGQIVVDGAPAGHWNETEARRAGISVVHQEIQLVPGLTVAQNMFLGDRLPPSGPVARVLSMRDDRSAEGRARELLAEIGVHTIDVRAKVATLSPSQAQLVLIARALRHQGRVLILDEPTAALAENERDELFALVRRLLARGTAVVLVTHHLHELEELAHHVTVLRNGVVAAQLSGAQITIPAMIRAMLDRDLDHQFPDVTHQPGAHTTLTATVSHPRLAGELSLSVRAGEILGVVGLLGAGKTELARSLVGLDGAVGTVSVEGNTVRTRDPRQAMRSGIVLVPEERKEQAVVPDLSVYDNGVLSYVAGSSPGRRRTSVLPKRPEIRAHFQELVSAVGVRFAAESQRASGLSGGNQQKLVISRALSCSPRVLVLDEPTRGVDVGSRRDIYEIVVEQARRGLSVVLVSSDTREVFSLAHRVLVLQGGAIAHEIADPRRLTHEQFAASLSPRGAALRTDHQEIA